MMTRDIPVDHLRSLLRYEPETGKLFWMERQGVNLSRFAEMNQKRFNADFAGKECFRVLSIDGYLHGTLNNKKVPAQQVIWALVHGVWSNKDMHVDHINGVRTDNRLVNLRLIPAAENIRGRIRRSYKHGGERGIARNTANGKWQVSIRIGQDRRKYLGCFDRIEDARTVRNEAEKSVLEYQVEA